eukprot:CAMPEP_0117765870 /NCGR_PEP_ID=MMETSP0947-20121206/20438_1 /TAXON_ID=44440 /ORGANISM="Chattonella subsalsa, Strain CCMP2191" /LENGTH=56 /DNA_ID=CAMNT_0005588745 /DNA_START=394 /DNA_END=561 /DNA_ORIENTATION=-
MEVVVLIFEAAYLTPLAPFLHGTFPSDLDLAPGLCLEPFLGVAPRPNDAANEIVAW